MIARWPIGRMAVAVYLLTYKFSEGSPTSALFFSVFSSRKWLGFGPVPGKATYPSRQTSHRTLWMLLMIRHRLIMVLYDFDTHDLKMVEGGGDEEVYDHQWFIMTDLMVQFTPDIMLLSESIIPTWVNGDSQSLSNPLYLHYSVVRAISISPFLSHTHTWHDSRPAFPHDCSLLLTVA